MQGKRPQARAREIDLPNRIWKANWYERVCGGMPDIVLILTKGPILFYFWKSFLTVSAIVEERTPPPTKRRRMPKIREPNDASALCT